MDGLWDLLDLGDWPRSVLGRCSHQVHGCWFRCAPRDQPA
jgi:hypothetical protein